MYFPDRTRTPPAAVGLSAAEEVVLDTADGERVIVWHIAPRGERPVFLYFHGNGGAIAYRASRFRDIVADGTGLVALSYRGYAGSSGRPSETGLLADGAAVYAFARASYPAGRIVMWGESLGSAVAVALAAKNPVGALVLEAPFTSAVDVGAAVYPFIPVRLLMWDQFRTDERIGQVAAPVLILHGARDRVVPIAFGERLFSLAREPKRFLRFPDGDHEGLDAYGAMNAAKDFVREHVR
jgi:fermentation-respiration switch protein FrsA (DUF1100 family)